MNGYKGLKVGKMVPLHMKISKLQKSDFWKNSELHGYSPGGAIWPLNWHHDLWPSMTLKAKTQGHLTNFAQIVNFRVENTIGDDIALNLIFCLSLKLEYDL